MTDTPQRLIDPVSDERFAAFNEADRHLLADFFLQYPDVGQQFDRYLDTSPSLRLRQAEHDLATIPRSGWVVRGIENPENVMEHCEGLVRLLQMQLQSLPEMSFSDFQKIKEMAKISDYAEAMVGDFRPGEVDAGTKHRVEYLAARILFEKHPKQLQLFEEYQQQETYLAKLASDFDKIHPVLIAGHYESQKPGIFEEFYQSASKRLNTDQGKELLSHLYRDKNYRDMVVENIHEPSFSRAIER